MNKFQQQSTAKQRKNNAIMLQTTLGTFALKVLAEIKKRLNLVNKAKVIVLHNILIAFLTNKD